MPVNFVPSGAEMLRILPEIILVLAGTLIMIMEPLTRPANKHFLGKFALASLFAALWGSVVAHANPGPAFQNMLIVDGFDTFFRILVIVVGILTVLASFQYLKREQSDSGEYYALILFSLVGQCVMAGANELIMVFIGLEISSIATYVLTGYLRDDKRAEITPAGSQAAPAPTSRRHPTACRPRRCKRAPRSGARWRRRPARAPLVAPGRAAPGGGPGTSR